MRSCLWPVIPPEADRDGTGSLGHTDQGPPAGSANLTLPEISLELQSQTDQLTSGPLFGRNLGSAMESML